jgi:hypothetical protein
MTGRKLHPFFDDQVVVDSLLGDLTVGSHAFGDGVERVNVHHLVSLVACVNPSSCMMFVPNLITSIILHLTVATFFFFTNITL